MNLKAALIDDVEEASVAGQRHIAGERSFEASRRRHDDVEWTGKRMCRAVEVYGSDDPPRRGITNPDVAVLAAGEIHTRAVGGEGHTHEAGVDIHALHRRCRTGKLADEGHGERS